MKKILLLSLALASSLFAQTPVNIQKVSGNLTADFSVATGRTLTIASGGTLTVAAGATFTFPAGSIPWSSITSTPTTLSGYGITDGVSTGGSYADPSWITSLASTKLTGFIAAARLPAFTGDITTSAGSVTTTLATVNANTGSWGTATAVPTFTVNGKGLITAATNTTISIPSTAISDASTIGKALLTAASAASARSTLVLATVANTGSYTDLINQPTFNSFSPMTTLGDIIYENATPAGARLAGSTSATKNFLTQTGNGTISAAPGWSVILNADVPTTLTGKTYNGLTLTALSTGFTVAGGTTSKTLTVPLDATVSGTNTGDQTISITGDVTASGSTGALASTVVKLNGVTLSGLATGLLKNTTGTGVPSIGVAGTDFQAPGSYITSLTGDATASGPGAAAATVVKVNGVAYGTSPSTNTVPVVTGANTVTYQTVPNAALANSTVTIGSTSTALGATSGTIAGVTLTGPVINGATSASGNFDLSGSSGTFKSNTGANTFGGAVTVNDATTPSITLPSGKTNTGFLLINGKTSGSVKIIPVDATAQAVTVSIAAQTTGAATVTLPDQAGTNRNLVTDTGTATLTNKALGASTTATAGITYTAGVTQTFAPNATSSGLNVGSVAGVPSGLNNGDLFYDSSATQLKARINGATVTLGAGGTGTVTHTGNLTANAIVLGNAVADTTVAAGLVTDGVSVVTLGVSGTNVGAVGFNNATSGKITLQPVTGALGSVTVSLPAATDTLVGKATTDTLTNKSMSGSANTFTNLPAAGITGLIPTANGGNAVDITTSAPSVVGGFGFRNRFTNGAIRIDQRRAGASLSSATFNSYAADKWKIITSTSSAGSSVQQVTDAPVGFNYSAKYTVGTGAAPSGADANILYQIVEAPEVADFNFGTANAVTATLSFWVKSSLTGTGTVSFHNSAVNRNYLAQYTINSANTWEQKTSTFTMDTSGTWLTAAGSIGCYVEWDLGSGASTEGTASTWQAGNLQRVSTNFKVISTTAATFQISGCQWERGTAATSFEQIPYALEFARCLRYCWVQSVSSGNGAFAGMLQGEGSTGVQGTLTYPVPQAVAPTITFSAAGNFFVHSNGGNQTPTGTTATNITPQSAAIGFTGLSAVTGGSSWQILQQTGTASITVDTGY